MALSRGLCYHSADEKALAYRREAVSPRSHPEPMGGCAGLCFQYKKIRLCGDKVIAVLYFNMYVYS